MSEKFQIQRGSTPTLTIPAPDIDLTGYRIYFAMKQIVPESGDETQPIIDKLATLSSVETAEDGSTTSNVEVTLTQEETLSAIEGARTYIQLRYVNESGDAGGTKKYPVTITGILKDGVITYEE